MSGDLPPGRLVLPGRVLKHELEARGWTQRDLAAILGRPEQAISEIIKGTKQITGEIHCSCVVIGLYGDTVLSLRGKIFQKRWLTMTQFRRLIERLDSKLEVIRTP